MNAHTIDIPIFKPQRGVRYSYTVTNDQPTCQSQHVQAQLTPVTLVSPSVLAKSQRPHSLTRSSAALVTIDVGFRRLDRVFFIIGLRFAYIAREKDVC